MWMPREDTELIAVFTQSVETGNNYKLTYTSNPPEGGTVTVTLPAGQIEEGTLPGIEYQFTATPNEGYEFINWTVDGEDYGDAPTLRLEAPEKDINVVANFMEVVYCTLRIASSDANMGSAGTAGGQNTVILKGGEKVTLTATPKDGYAFSGWTIDGVVVSSDNPFEYTIPAQEEVTITANFREIVISYPDDRVFQRGYGYCIRLQRRGKRDLARGRSGDFTCSRGKAGLRVYRMDD